MDADKARKLFDEADLIHSAEVVSAAVSELAAQIKSKLADKNPLVLCVMTGGLIFCGQLLTRLDFPLEFDYLHVTRYGQETAGGALSWRSAPCWPPPCRTTGFSDSMAGCSWARS